MKKFFCIIHIIAAFSGYGFTAHNDYLDPGLVEKSGQFNVNRYLLSNYIAGFYSTGTNGVTEGGVKLDLHYDLPYIKGVFFNAEFSMSNLSSREVSGDASRWWGGNIPFFGETNFGISTKYFYAKLGYQNVVSSDAIYNHLIIDDYSGTFFAYRSELMVSQYVDFQAIYNIVRWHQSSWYNGESSYNWEYMRSTIDYNDLEDSDYQAKYGKSLYFHKMNLRPFPWLRFGLMESVYFLGENFNPYFANPFFIYFATAMINELIGQKSGSSQNLLASDVKIGLDFNAGYEGVRLYGEMLLDDANGEYFKFQTPNHPDRVGFIIGGEIRGYIFDKYLRLPRVASYIVRNLYINCEYGIVSKYTYSRDPNFNYEYVREEYPYRYFPKEYASHTTEHPDYIRYKNSDRERVNRIGNYIGFMYGPNSDCLDIAIGWRNDLNAVEETNAGYIADRYFDSMKKKYYPDRLIKFQAHYRRWRLGDGRDVVVPFYNNEHYFYDNNPYLDSDGDGDPENDKTDLRTGFLEVVLEEHNDFYISFYMDLLKVSRNTLGIELETDFLLSTYLPNTDSSATYLDVKFDIAAIINF